MHDRSPISSRYRGADGRAVDRWDPVGRRAIMVLGMHRSGTSALTRLCSLLGADLPTSLLPAEADNETGYWESSEIRVLNDQILTALGSSWDDWRAVDAEWYGSSEAAAFKQRLIDLLHRDFGASRLFVLKDPRICRLLPLWLDVLGEFGARPAVVIPVRNPFEVALSLQKRDGFPASKSYLLWLRHVLEAEQGTRHLPRAVTTYDGLLADWRGLAAKLADRADIAWPNPVALAEEEVGRFLSVGLRHHAVAPQRSRAELEFLDWVQPTYSIMLRMAKSGDDENSLDRLDRIAKAFDKASRLFSAVISPVAGTAEPDTQELKDAPPLMATLAPPDAEDEITDLRRSLATTAERDEITATEAAGAQGMRVLGHSSDALQAFDRQIAEPADGSRDERSRDTVGEPQPVTIQQEPDERAAELAALHAELGLLRALSGRRPPRSVPFAATRGRPLTGLWWTDVALARILPLLPQAWQHVFARSAQVRAIRRSGLFDEAWYLKRNPDVAASGVNPLLHYISYGAWERRNPHPLFDTDWYLMTYPDAARQGLTPLAHFVSVGAANGYDPNPLFHTNWYVAQNADVSDAQVNPLRHYIEHAAEEGRDPNPLFASAWYLQENPDVAAAGENPLAHYIHHGIGEMRDPHPLFDTEWYLKQYEEVAESGLDPLEHYLSIGALKGCRPGPSLGVGRRAPRLERRPLAADAAPLDAWPPEEGIADSPSSEAPSPLDVRHWRLSLSGKLLPGAQSVGPIGVFVHLFYDDLAEEIASSLAAIPFDFQVYVSTNNSRKKAAIEAVFEQHGLKPVVKVMRNRGWDIAPFVLGFADEIRKHEICLKIHGKQSRLGAEKIGGRWRRHLLSGLLGDAENVSYVMRAFSSQPQLGILMLRHWHGVPRRSRAIGANYLPMQTVLGKLGLAISPDQSIEFPSGSMFWFRSAALAPLLDLGLTWSDFNACRSHNVDATIAHGLERSMLIFAAKAGYRWAYLPRRWALSWTRQQRGGDPA